MINVKISTEKLENLNSHFVNTFTLAEINVISACIILCMLLEHLVSLGLNFA